jgi:hypothetical protein
MHCKAQVEFALLNTTSSSLKLDDLQVERIRIARGGFASFLTLVKLQRVSQELTHRTVPGMLEEALSVCGGDRT